MTITSLTHTILSPSERGDCADSVAAVQNLADFPTALINRTRLAVAFYRISPKAR